MRIGYAADERGEGVVYALVSGAAGESLMRTGFRVRRLGGAEGREIGYAALTAVVGALRGRGSGALDIEIADDAIVAEVEGRRPIPPALAMPYVTLRCSLNGLAQARIHSVDREKVADLEARARAEVSLHVAA
ncbi:MAG TPA: hypothetical protein VN905_12085 [Candidatus Binatia bacterium]|nr:hypothetical protein [Candidatus Binatia bacterium]